MFCRRQWINALIALGGGGVKVLHKIVENRSNTNLVLVLYTTQMPICDIEFHIDNNVVLIDV